MHSWNLMNCGGATNALADGLIVHGAPNHSFSSTEGDGITLRNCVIYNAQDCAWIVNAKNLVMENCTLFGGITIKEWTMDEYPSTSSGKSRGGQRLRRSDDDPQLHHHGRFYGASTLNSDTKWEENTLFENNIILTMKPNKAIFHLLSDDVNSRHRARILEIL